MIQSQQRLLTINKYLMLSVTFYEVKNNLVGKFITGFRISFVDPIIYFTYNKSKQESPFF